MNSLSLLLGKQIKHYQKWDFLIFLLLTSLSILNGSTTIFYILYFFWWYELIRIITDRIFCKSNKNAVLSGQKKTQALGSFFPMGIYFVFLVVFFGFIANWNNDNLMQINMEILFFQNWFFNMNLIFVIIERILVHKMQQPVRVSSGLFTTNMIILHISIILGAVLMFFVVYNFPETFTPDNLWGSVIIIFPFLLIRALAVRYKWNS